MKTFFKIFGWVMWKRKWFGLTVFLGVIIGFTLEFSSPYFYKELSLVFLQPFSEETGEKALFIVSLYIAVWAVQWTSWRIIDFSMIPFQAKGMRDIERWGFEVMTQQNFDFFQNAFSGSLVKKIGKMVRAYEAILDWILFSFLNIFLNILVSCILLFWADMTLGILFLGWTILYFIFSVGFSLWHLQFNERTAKADSEIGGLFSDAVSNISTILSSISEKFEMKKIKYGTQKVYRARKIAWSLAFVSFAIQGLFFMAAEIFALFYFWESWENGNFNIGLFILFQTIYLPASWNMWIFGKSLRELFYAFGDLKEFEEILDATPPQNPQKTNEMKIAAGEISFQNVNFSYEKSNPHLNPLPEGEGTKGLFQNFSLEIAAGERIALVGHSGSGKSTLVKMLFDFISPQSGKILVDGQNIAECTNASVRKNFSLVSQTTDLFHRSLKENIAYDTNATDEQIWEAVQKAQCEDFILNLPEKLETFVGERGVKLSGGERQRVALARAFLKNSPIVILDEPTSALDSLTEQKIQVAIAELLKEKTAIVIAHRLSTIFQMDKIVVLEKGKIIEMGTHAELLENNGKYAKMWTHQKGGFLGEEESENIFIVEKM